MDLLLSDYASLPRRRRPKRKVVKKHIAEIIEKMLEEANPPSNETSKKDMAETKADQIDQVCYVQYGEDGIKYQQCVTNELQKETEQLNIATGTSKTLCQEFIEKMTSALPALSKCLSESNFENKYAPLTKQEIIWLMDFIQMVSKRNSTNGIEENVSITYFSSFLPITQKIDSANKLKLAESDIPASDVCLMAPIFGDDFLQDEADWIF